MKNRSRMMIMTAVLLVGAAIWLPGLRSRRAAAQSTGLTGSYGFTVTDLNNPNVTMGVFTFDGAGRVTASNFTNVRSDPDPNGTMLVQTAQATGTYTVNADGTGVVTLQIPGSAALQISFVATDAGSSLMLLKTGGGGAVNDVQTGTARKQ